MTNCPGGRWIFEPKWDGFRALIFRDGDEILIQSRDEKPLNRYFPELIEPLRAQLPARCVLDGEIVIAKNGGLDFDALQLRLHPAASRVKLLSQADSGVRRVLRSALRRRSGSARANRFKAGARELESLLSSAAPPIHLTPATRESSVAADWFRRFEGAGLDGVMAKPVSGTYEPNKRVMLKVKHERDCDCVVAGFRWHKKGEGTAVGSLLLGLFDDPARCSTWASARASPTRSGANCRNSSRPIARTRSPITPGRAGRSMGRSGEAGHRMPGGQSRWSQGKDLSWEPLRPELVVEVAYEHMQGARFRHMAQFRRWRTDKKPSDCTYAQLEVVPPQELMAIFASGR